MVKRGKTLSWEPRRIGCDGLSAVRPLALLAAARKWAPNRTIRDDAVVRPAAGEVLHFSEDPTITVFAPHVPRTGRVTEPLVWAVDAAIAPAYWFPRECPRVMAWVTSTTRSDDRSRVIGPGGGERVHAIEYARVDNMRGVRLFAYRLSAAKSWPLGEPVPYAWVASETIEPLGPPEPVGDLIALHHHAGIQLRVLPSIRPFWEAVKGTTLGFSGIRLHNARLG